MKWYWLLTIITSAVSICFSDDAKRKSWATKAADKQAPMVDRIGSLLVIAIAVWQLMETWSR